MLLRKISGVQACLKLLKLMKGVLADCGQALCQTFFFTAQLGCKAVVFI